MAAMYVCCSTLTPSFIARYERDGYTRPPFLKLGVIEVGCVQIMHFLGDEFRH